MTATRTRTNTRTRTTRTDATEQDEDHDNEDGPDIRDAAPHQAEAGEVGDHGHPRRRTAEEVRPPPNETSGANER